MDLVRRDQRCSYLTSPGATWTIPVGGRSWLASSPTSAATDITTILGRVTAAVATAAGVVTRTDGRMTTLLSRITGLRRIGEADTAHGLLATAADLPRSRADTTTLLSRITGCSIARRPALRRRSHPIGARVVASADLDTQLAAKAAATEAAAIRARQTTRRTTRQTRVRSKRQSRQRKARSPS